MGDTKRATKPKLTIDDFHVPGDVEELNDQVRSARVPAINTLAQQYFASGSETAEIQFIALRIVFPLRVRIVDFAAEEKREEYGLETWAWEQAVELVDKCTEFEKYIEIVKSDIPIDGLTRDSPLWPGSLKPVRKIQEQVMTVKGVHDRDRRPDSTARSLDALILEATSRIRKGEKQPLAKRQLEESSPTKAEKAVQLPGADDEAAPNVAIVLLLQGILDLVPGTAMEWQLDHLHLQGKFESGVYSAYTDGGLLSKLDRSIHAIVEAKKRPRTEKMKTIQMQEGAEIVGLILSDKGRKPLKNYHVVVSQDRDEVYITFASWHQEYLSYLRGGPVTANSHLTMQTVGPWLIGRGLHMKHFATVVTTIILMAKKMSQDAADSD